MVLQEQMVLTVLQELAVTNGTSGVLTELSGTSGTRWDFRN
jgi:hypothetical protein